MSLKTGNGSHGKGNGLPRGPRPPGGGNGYAAAVGAALRRDLAGTGRGAKTVMRWTGASERAVKDWLSGRRGPSGEHLILLMRHSAAVAAAIAVLTGRVEVVERDSILELRRHLEAACTCLQHYMMRTFEP